MKKPNEEQIKVVLRKMYELNMMAELRHTEPDILTSLLELEWLVEKLNSPKVYRKFEELCADVENVQIEKTLDFALQEVQKYFNVHDFNEQPPTTLTRDHVYHIVYAMELSGLITPTSEYTTSVYRESRAQIENIEKNLSWLNRMTDVLLDAFDSLESRLEDSAIQTEANYLTDLLYNALKEELK